MPYVIGTAGHVDHGKSTLVYALTGMDPDRLAEEKSREMTIDLGFAWFDLPNGESVGIVDVPGHRDFIENMLAGIGGIDLALFVVAADEGVMPQTKEHLAILDLLEIPRAVVALTKTDLIVDAEWLDLVTLDLAHALENTVLESAPIIPVSARTGAGLNDLLAALQQSLEEGLPRPDRGLPRMPVDRVFTMSGFGTVVTGTLSDGSLAIGDEIEIAPTGLRARIRGIQTHRAPTTRAIPGNRVALNLSNISTSDVVRGNVVSFPGSLKGSSLVDAQFRYLADAERPLKHNAEVKFFSGSVEAVANLRLIGTTELFPGDSGWLQIKLTTPIALASGDRFILRYPSPGKTIGGGTILEAHPSHRWRRFKPETLKRFETLAAGTPEDVILQVLESQAALTLAQLSDAVSLPQSEVASAMQTLLNTGAAIAISEKWFLATTSWNRIIHRLVNELANYHSKQPLHIGMPREALRSRLSMDAKLFNAVIETAADSSTITETSAMIHLSEHAVAFTEAQEAAVKNLMKQIQANPAVPPNPKDMIAQVGGDVLQVLLDRGDLVQLNPDVVMDSATLFRWQNTIETYFEDHETITVGQVRDLLATSRKYALGMLEYMDNTGITRRIGDYRVLRGSYR